MKEQDFCIIKNAIKKRDIMEKFFFFLQNITKILYPKYINNSNEKNLVENNIKLLLRILHYIAVLQCVTLGS